MENAVRPSFSLRPANADDIPALVSLEESIQVAPWTPAHFQAELEKPFSHLWLLTDDETDSLISGYIVFWDLGEGTHILNVGVGLEYRGQGYGKLLVRAAIRDAIARNQSKIFLEVRKANLPAVALYQGLGFDICQIRKHFYSIGDDAYVMQYRGTPLDSDETE